jgi:hypothetical protein
MAARRTGPVIDYIDINGSNEKRLMLAYRQGSALGIFSALSDLVRPFAAAVNCLTLPVPLLRPDLVKEIRWYVFRPFA